MNVTPEFVRAEMNYRVERAHADAAVRQLRAGRRTHRGWLRRLRDHGDDHAADDRPAVRNGAPRVA